MGCVPASGSCKFKYSSRIPESPLQLNMGVSRHPSVSEMAGYSGKPLVDKLGLKAGDRVILLGAPSTYPAGFGALPEGVHLSRRLSAADVALVFSRDAGELSARFPQVVARLASGGMVWVAWPKKASKEPTDLTEDVVRRIGLDAGLVDVKVCAIDETWSGLKFLRRRPSKRT